MNFINKFVYVRIDNLEQPACYGPGPKKRDAVTRPFLCERCRVLHFMCTAKFLISG